MNTSLIVFLWGIAISFYFLPAVCISVVALNDLFTKSETVSDIIAVIIAVLFAALPIINLLFALTLEDDCREAVSGILKYKIIKRKKKQ